MRSENRFGCWSHATRAPDRRLAPLMYRDLLGFDQHRAEFASWLEAPRPALTLMIDLQGAITADDQRLPGAWLGGLSDRYTVVGFDGRYRSIDLELTPLGGLAVLGRPLSHLDGSVVALDELFGEPGHVLAERLREAPGWDTCFDLIERFLLMRLAAAVAPTPAVEWAYARLWATEGRVRIEALAAEIGCSRRYLSRCFAAELGLSPKRVARLIRFEHVCRRVRAQPSRWAQIAVEAGFCDQPHLNREFRELSGTTPADFIARCLPDGGVIGDGVPFVQDSV